LTRASGENVGTYDISEGNLSLPAGYQLNFVDSNLSITQRPVTVIADAQSKPIGNMDPLLTYRVTSGNLVSGDHFSGSLTRTAGEGVGSYAIKQGTLALSSNYALTYFGNNLTITPGTLGQPLNPGLTDAYASQLYKAFDPKIDWTISGSTPSVLTGFSSGETLSTKSMAQQILDSAGIDYLTAPALSDLLARLLLKIPLGMISQGEQDSLTRNIVAGLKTEFKNKGVTAADLHGLVGGFVGGIVVDVVASAWVNNAPKSMSPYAVELVHYAIEIIGNGAVASWQTKDPAVGFSIGLIYATAGEVIDTTKQGLGLIFDIQNTKTQIGQLNSLIDQTEVQIKVAGSDKKAVARLLKEEKYLKGARNTLQEFVSHPF
jgi:hypothetical protein